VPRLAVVATLVGFVLIASGCAGESSNDEFPSWLPSELAGLRFSPATASDLPLAEAEAVEAVRRRVFPFGGPAAAPDTFPTLVTGSVLTGGSIPVPPDGQVVLRKVKDEPAWLVVWRGIPANLREPLSDRDEDDDELMDFVAFVDPETRALLANVSLFGPNRLI
jgi:hypothetical protein